MNKSLRHLVYIILVIFNFNVNSQQLYINEFCASNASSYMETTISYNFLSWIEIYNNENYSVNLGGYYLTDDFAEPSKWQVPAGTTIAAKGYYIFFADDRDTVNHTSFELDCKGEYIGLYNSSLTLVDSISYGLQLMDISYGRKPDGSSSWYYFGQPTPLTSNNTEGIALKTTVTPAPQFSIPGGFYTGSQSVTLTCTSPSATIRYTTDGSKPTSSSTAYSSSINVSSTTVIRACAFETGYLPSPVITYTYLINPTPHTLPVISVSTKPAYLWDNTIGMYVVGTNGAYGYGVYGNYYQDWERPFNIEYYEPDGNMAFNMNVGLKMHGGAMRKRPIKAMAVHARDKYGDDRIDYKFFNEKSINSFKNFLLRNSGNDWHSTMYRDAMIQTLLIGQMDIDYQSYRPSILYINGSYWGIHNIRELAGKDYPDANYGYDSDSIDYIKNDYIIKAGDSLHYSQMIDFLENNGMSQKANYEYIKTQMDMNEYINYQIAQIYAGNHDWPGNNLRFWRPKTADGKWRWIICDTDFGFGLYVNYNENTLALATDSTQTAWPNPAWSTFLFRKLLKNDEFKSEFINRFIYHINTTFDPDRVINIIDSMKAIIAPEMPEDIQRWKNECYDYCGIPSLSAWETDIEIMREFARKRPQYMLQFLSDMFGLGETADVIFSNKNGQISVNGYPVTQDSSVYTCLKDSVLALEAVPNTGYKFSQWQVVTDGGDNTFFDAGAEWKYLDNGTNQGTAWGNNGFDDSGWSSGYAQFGYGDGDETTVVSYGPNSSSKYITTYFRKSFNITDASAFQDLTLEILRDDGAVVYLNGNEVARTNMPTSSITYTTLASSAVGSTDETTFFSYTVNSQYLVDGANVIAVEVHQSSAASSDLSFDMKLYGNYTTEWQTISANKDITFNVLGDTAVKAVFAPADTIKNLFINEFMASNISYLTDDHGEYEDWIEIYNAGPDTVNLGTLFVTDSLGNPLKWQIPRTKQDETILLPDDFIVLWADDDAKQGVLHLGFKLSAGGEEIGLAQMIGSDTVLIDSLIYGSQNANISFGSYPDGSDNRIPFAIPTPGESNVNTFRQDITKVNHGIYVYPNPSSGIINIKTEPATDKDMSVEISSVNGQIVYNKPLNGSNVKHIDLSAFPKGIYFVKVKNEDIVRTAKIVLY